MEKRRPTNQEDKKKENIVATIDLALDDDDEDDDNVWGNEEDDLLLSQVQVSDMPTSPKHVNNYNMEINSHSFLQNVTFTTFAKQKIPTSTQNYSRHNNHNQREYEIELNDLKTIEKNNANCVDSQNIRTTSILKQLKSTATTSQLNSQIHKENEITTIAKHNNLQSIKENKLCIIIDNLKRQISAKDMELEFTVCGVAMHKFNFNIIIL